MFNTYQTCIEACAHCAVVCRQCAASCLAEPDVEHMVPCIQLDLSCAAICEATAQQLILSSNYANRICELCADICNACAEECEKHEMDHCQDCAAACRVCASQCMSMVAA